AGSRRRRPRVELCRDSHHPGRVRPPSAGATRQCGSKSREELHSPMTPQPGFLTPSARVIALDVGGTSVKSALVVPGGQVIGEPSITPIDSSSEADRILNTFT